MLSVINNSNYQSHSCHMCIYFYMLGGWTAAQQTARWKIWRLTVGTLPTANTLQDQSGHFRQIFLTSLVNVSTSSVEGVKTIRYSQGCLEARLALTVSLGRLYDPIGDRTEVLGGGGGLGTPTHHNHNHTCPHPPTTINEHLCLVANGIIEATIQQLAKCPSNSNPSPYSVGREIPQKTLIFTTAIIFNKFAMGRQPPRYNCKKYKIKPWNLELCTRFIVDSCLNSFRRGQLYEVLNVAII